MKGKVKPRRSSPERRRVMRLALNADIKDGENAITLLSWDIIKDRIANSTSLLEELMDIYGRIPPTQCARKTDCCKLLPEATLVEVLVIVRRLKNLTSESRRRLCTKLIEYFFLNPVEITSCPFLEGQDCLIYPERYFGCRAYGLWSHKYYKKLTGWNRRSKVQLQAQWKRLGITLPKQIVEFDLPYCSEVETQALFQIDDQILTDVWDAIKILSERFSPEHRIFQQNYFGDMSFLFSSLVFGFNKALQMKYNVVKEMVIFENRKAFENIMNTLPDFDL